MRKIDCDHWISLLPVWQGWAKSGSDTGFDVILACSSDNPGLSLHEYTVFVVRILAFSFTLFDSRTKWRFVSLVPGILFVWQKPDWWCSPFLHWFLHYMACGAGGRHHCLQPAELSPGCDCLWFAVTCLGWYFKCGYTREWWAVI